MVWNRSKKGITLEQVEAAVVMCKRAGVTPYASFILGLPGETPETIEETMDFGKKMKQMGLSYGFHLLAPFPGTEVRNFSDQYGIQILTDDWSRYHANRTIVETQTVDHKMLDDIVVKWEKEYDDYLANIKDRMGESKASQKEIWEIENLEKIVLIYDLMMNSAIEQNGFWRHNGLPISEGEIITMLSIQISQATDDDPERLCKTLGHAVKQGALKYEITNGEIRCQWADYL